MPRSAFKRNSKAINLSFSTLATSNYHVDVGNWIRLSILCWNWVNAHSEIGLTPVARFLRLILLVSCAMFVRGFDQFIARK